MAWEEIEFGCNDCGKFFITRLHKRLGGKDVLVQCPGCSRKHPRSISAAGDVTGAYIERLYKDGEGKRLSRNHKENEGEVILGLKCTLSDKSRFDKVNTAKTRDKGGFLSRLWLRAHGHGDDDEQS